MNDNIRAALIATIQSLFPVLQILGVINWTSDQIALVMLFITNLVTMAFLVFKAPPAVPIGAAAVMAIVALAASTSSQTAAAAVNCNVRHEIRIDIIDLNKAPAGSRIVNYGAAVKVSPNPTGDLGTKVFVDNSENDASNTLGRIVIADACAGLYGIELQFDKVNLNCDVVDPQRSASNLLAPTTASYEVSSCQVPPEPTASPTMTPTATSTPSPTQTPVILIATPTATTQPPSVVVVTATPTAAPPVAAQLPTIRPPATGDAGLR